MCSLIIIFFTISYIILSSKMHFHSNILGTSSHGWVFFVEADVDSFDGREIRKDSLGNALADMLQKLGGCFHFFLDGGVDVGIANRPFQFVGFGSLGEVCL